MSPAQQFAAYLAFLDKLNVAIPLPQRERVIGMLISALDQLILTQPSHEHALYTLTSALDQATSAPPPYVIPNSKPFASIRIFLTATQYQIVIDAFRDLIKEIYSQPADADPRTKRHPVNRRSSFRKKHS